MTKDQCIEFKSKVNFLIDAMEKEPEQSRIFSDELRKVIKCNFEYMVNSMIECSEKNYHKVRVLGHFPDEKKEHGLDKINIPTYEEPGFTIARTKMLRCPYRSA